MYRALCQENNIRAPDVVKPTAFVRRLCIRIAALNSKDVMIKCVHGQLKNVDNLACSK